MDDTEAIGSLQAIIDWSSSFQLSANLLGREAMDVTHALEHAVKAIEALAAIRELCSEARDSDDARVDVDLVEALVTP